MIDHSPCVICGGAVARREKEGPETWMRRPTCGRICGRQYQLREHQERRAQAAREHPPCRNPQCRRPITQHEGECPKDYRERRYCSSRCAAKAGWATRLTAPRPYIPVQGPLPSTEDFVRNGGPVTYLPPRYAAPTLQGALYGSEARKRIKAIILPPEPKSWGSIPWAFGGAR